LAQSQPQGVLLTALAQGFLHILGQTIEPIGRTRPLDPLMRSLVVVVVDPVIESLAGVGKGGEDRLAQKLAPDRLPEALDLAQRHRMVRCTADVADALLAQHLLKTRLPAPGYELPTMVGQDLSRCAPLAQRALQDLEHRFAALLAKQAPAYQKARVIVDDPHHVDPVHALELEGEDIDLPERVG